LFLFSNSIFADKCKDEATHRFVQGFTRKLMGAEIVVEFRKESREGDTIGDMLKKKKDQKTATRKREVLESDGVQVASRVLGGTVASVKFTDMDDDSGA
jgi:hypothetical protein